jgi:hypothetical protein
VRRLATWALGVLALISLAGCEVGTPPGTPKCDAPGDAMVLVAQSVPSATQLPCVAELPAGWRFEEQQVASRITTFWLGSDIAGTHAVQVELQPGCDIAGAVSVPSTAEDELGLERFDRPEQLRPLRLVRFYRFEGGCIVYRYAFSSAAPSSLQFEADEALSFLPRADVVQSVAKDYGLRLCGAGISCAG